MSAGGLYWCSHCKNSLKYSPNEEKKIKAMFVSQEKNVGKKTFQKPNILRRKPKISGTTPNISTVNESLGTKSLVTSSLHVNKPSISACETLKFDVSSQPTVTKTSLLKFSVANNNVDKSDMNTSKETDIEANIFKYTTASSFIAPIGGVDKSNEESTFNIASFVNNKLLKQSMSLDNIDEMVYTVKNEIQPKPEWCFDLHNNDVKIQNYSVNQLADTEEKSHFVVEEMPSVILTSVNPLPKQPHEVITTTPTRTVSVELISNRAVKFKCDEVNCNKGFWTEERLRKHKNSHNRQTTVRPPSQMTIECPVKKVHSDGVEEKCPCTFQVRRELLKHLNTDHTPEDALHRCEVCGRRFFWASGLRAHAQSVCARGGLACAWPGCTRVFRLPCRLREHARAHTGDRPYHCRYPECGWAFRSASKLVRHARRHTGERRHACAACGRAFLRREHLRDHVARHHLPAARAPHRCAHPGCEQSFTNMSTLYMHMKKVHRKDENESVSLAVSDQVASEEVTAENMYLVSVVPEGEAEWHAARTHCTWPLAPRKASPPPAYVLDDDVHVENAEGSTSNVYTVRSDLFLHGNIPIDDDSQNIAAEMADSSGAVAAIDTDLCLIDSHPTIDLMSEELMYEDTAVDESSFRVLLMNGEELAL
ncbi:unnamed protein product [Arctia plantaginis]|uniref:C2H2-type domain-containing protein n=1 Tax=Arctia plantaginis TaxID=874455 RepID=A0A8S1A748_ARCPL|nr:unnamed protein product [Arctia plantaginis]